MVECVLLVILGSVMHVAHATPTHARTHATPVLGWTLLNGLAEPLGVVLGGVLLAPWLSNALLSRVLATVGGIMTCISIHELQPTAIAYAGKWRASVSCFAGMAICWMMLVMVDQYFGHSHGTCSHKHDHH